MKTPKSILIRAVETYNTTRVGEALFCVPPSKLRALLDAQGNPPQPPSEEFGEPSSNRELLWDAEGAVVDIQHWNFTKREWKQSLVRLKKQALQFLDGTDAYSFCDIDTPASSLESLPISITALHQVINIVEKEDRFVMLVQQGLEKFEELESFEHLYLDAQAHYSRTWGK